MGDQVFRANNRDPYVDGAAASLVKSVAGLDTGEFRHPLVVRPAAPPRLNGAAASRSKIGGSAFVAKDSKFYTNDCFPGVEKETFSNLNNGSFPIGTYAGNKLGDASATSVGCGYTPPEIQAAYGLTALYANGYDGSGQIIGIIDWCGSSTILQDANGFSKKFGLPKLVLGSNFNITYIPTPSECVAAGNLEINLDVEWAHAIAPGAYINLIVPPSASFQDLDEAEYISIVSGLANVLSGSYGAPEFEVAQAELENGNLISEVAATMGISTNFSSGDSAAGKKDQAALESILAGRLSWIARGERLNKAQVVVDYLSGNLHFRSFAHDSEVVNIFGDTAVVTGHSTSVLEYQGKLFDAPRLYTDVLIKMDGRWQLVAHHVSELSKP